MIAQLSKSEDEEDDLKPNQAEMQTDSFRSRKSTTSDADYVKAAQRILRQ